MWASNLKKSINNQTYKPKKAKKFLLCERGKVREIYPVHISDRVVQKLFNDKILKPITYPHLIYHNGASRIGKGTDFQLNEFKKHLRKHINKYGNNGYILFIDFSNYFGNIDKEILIKKLNLPIEDIILFKKLTDCSDGLTLGSEANQICAIFYPSNIDHYIKEQLKIKCYGRYMDDMYLIHNDIKYLEYCKNKILKECDKLNIIVNPKKIKIIKLTDQFTFLKKQFKITNTGKILMRPVRKNYKLRRKCLVNYKKLYDSNIMSLSQVENSYKIWKGFAIKNGSPQYIINNMDKYYNNLFKED